MSEARVSVVIVVRNGERYLAAAIKSVLAQTLQPYEVVVIDDGSTDASLSIAQRFGPPVRCVSQAQRGIGGARNAGVRATRGNYLAFLDADDLWTPDSVACELGAFAADPRLELVFGHVRQFISPDVDEETAGRLVCRPGLEPGYLVGAALVRREALERVGEFREDVMSGDFVDWMSRAREIGLNESLIDEHVLWRRIHASNHGRRHVGARADYARILKSALDRRRAADR